MKCPIRRCVLDDGTEASLEVQKEVLKWGADALHHHPLMDKKLEWSNGPKHIEKTCTDTYSTPTVKRPPETGRF